MQAVDGIPNSADLAREGMQTQYESIGRSIMTNRAAASDWGIPSPARTIQQVSDRLTNDAITGISLPIGVNFRIRIAGASSTFRSAQTAIR